MKTVVIIPTYNEIDNIEKIISMVFSNLPNVYILVVDDNSPDGTRNVVKRMMGANPKIYLLEREKKEGLGKAYINAFNYLMDNINPEVVVMMDADISHPPDVLPYMYERIGDYDVVVGSRYVPSGDTVGWELWRKALSRYGNIYARLITGIPVKDLTAGFYMIRVGALKRVNLNHISSSGYAFQIELKNLFYRSGARFLEYPIIFKNRIGGESKISNHIIKEGILAPWRIRFKKVDSKTVDCQICRGKSFFWGQKNNYQLFQCDVCKLIFVDPLPNDVKIYSEDYFSGAKEGFGYTDYDYDKEPMIPVFNRYLDLVQQFGKKTGKLFDVGAATGFFLSLAKKRWFDVSGVEFSTFATDIAKDKGLDVSSGDFLDLDLKNESLDVVTMLDVIEHMKDPFSELLKTRDILKKDGLLLINTPNGESFLAKLLKTKWHLVVPPEHLYYFSPKNLKMFLEKNGFKVVYSSNIGKSFTFAYIFKTLHKWLKLSIFKFLSEFFSKESLKKLSIPINLYDNFLMIAKKV